MADAQVNVSVNDGNITALRQKLQEVVDANRIALNLRQQNQTVVIKASKASAG